MEGDGTCEIAMIAGSCQADVAKGLWSPRRERLLCVRCDICSDSAWVNHGDNHKNHFNTLRVNFQT